MVMYICIHTLPQCTQHVYKVNAVNILRTMRTCNSMLRVYVLCSRVCIQQPFEVLYFVLSLRDVLTPGKVCIRVIQVCM